MKKSASAGQLTAPRLQAAFSQLSAPARSCEAVSAIHRFVQGIASPRPIPDTNTEAMPNTHGPAPSTPTPVAISAKLKHRVRANPYRGTRTLVRKTPLIEPINCAVKNNPARSSVSIQREASNGRIGPSSVVTTPVSTKPT